MSLRIGGKEFNEEQVQALLDAGLVGVGQKHDTSSATPNAVPTHGPFPGNNAQFGIFSGAGVRPGMWNGLSRVTGIGPEIPLYPTTFYQELIDVATGVTAGSGNNVTTACTVGPKPGALKGARLTATFGMIHESTKIFDITQAGMRRNRADIDREFYNGAAAQMAWLPQAPGLANADLNRVMQAEMFALGVDLERNINQVHILGVSGTQDNTYRGVATQWDGIDRIIRTGYTDAVTGLAVPRLDSNVVSYNAALTGSDAKGRSIIRAITETFFTQQDLARHLGITGEWVLVMRPSMFLELAHVWACSFSTDRCAGVVGNPVQRDGVVTYNAFLDLYNNSYLPIEGTNVRVVMDDSVPRDVLGNQYYKSDIYGLCLRGNGRPVIYGEYFDMNNMEANEIATALGINDGTTTTLNNGMYRVFKRVTGGCVEYDFVARPRVISDAPFLHFRVDDVWYNSYTNQVDPIPGASFYLNGGKTYLS